MVLELFRSRFITGLRDSPLSVLLTASHSGDGYTDALKLPRVFLEAQSWPTNRGTLNLQETALVLSSHRYMFRDVNTDVSINSTLMKVDTTSWETCSKLQCFSLQLIACLTHAATLRRISTTTRVEALSYSQWQDNTTMRSTSSSCRL